MKPYLIIFVVILIQLIDFSKAEELQSSHTDEEKPEENNSKEKLLSDNEEASTENSNSLFDFDFDPTKPKFLVNKDLPDNFKKFLSDSHKKLDSVIKQPGLTFFRHSKKQPSTEKLGSKNSPGQRKGPIKDMSKKSTEKLRLEKTLKSARPEEAHSRSFDERPINADSIDFESFYTMPMFGRSLNGPKTQMPKTRSPETFLHPFLTSTIPEERSLTISHQATAFIENDQPFIKPVPIQQPIMKPLHIQHKRPIDPFKFSFENYTSSFVPAIPEKSPLSFSYQTTAYIDNDPFVKQPTQIQHPILKSIKYPQFLADQQFSKPFFENSTYVSMLHSRTGHLLCNVIHIHKNIVITAASCLFGLDLQGSYVTVAYLTFPKVKTKNYSITRIEIHPKYNLVANDFNIALLYLYVHKEEHLRTIPFMSRTGETYHLLQSVQIMRWRHFTSTEKATLTSNMGKIVQDEECVAHTTLNSGVCIKTGNDPEYSMEITSQDRGMPIVGRSKCDTEYLIGFYVGFGTPQKSTLHQFEPIYKYVDWIIYHVENKKRCAS